MIRVSHADKNVQLSANASSWAPRTCNGRGLRKAGVPECTTVSNSILPFAFGVCRIASFAPVVDSYTFLRPIREFGSRKGWHNRIRHVDPPQSNLFQELKLTQQARAHDPDPHRRADTDTYVPTPRGQIRIRSSMCKHRAGNCLQMRAAGLVAFRQLRILEPKP